MLVSQFFNFVLSHVSASSCHAKLIASPQSWENKQIFQNVKLFLLRKKKKRRQTWGELKKVTFWTHISKIHSFCYASHFLSYYIIINVFCYFVSIYCCSSYIWFPFVLLYSLLTVWLFLLLMFYLLPSRYLLH